MSRQTAHTMLSTTCQMLRHTVTCQLLWKSLFGKASTDGVDVTLMWNSILDIFVCLSTPTLTLHGCMRAWHYTIGCQLDIRHATNLQVDTGSRIQDIDATRHICCIITCYKTYHYMLQLWTNNFWPLQFWKQAGSLVLELKSMKTNYWVGFFVNC